MLEAVSYCRTELSVTTKVVSLINFYIKKFQQHSMDGHFSGHIFLARGAIYA